MNKNEMIAELIANGAWSEEDRDFLAGLPEDKFNTIYRNAVSESGEGQEASDETNDESKDADADGEDENEDNFEGTKTAGTQKVKTKSGTKAGECAVGNEATSVEEFLAHAPAAVREVLNEGLQTRNQRRAAAIKTITANQSNKLSAKELGAMTLNQLESIAAMAKANKAAPVANQRPRPLFEGQGMAITENAQSGQQPFLVAPSMDFAKK